MPFNPDNLADVAQLSKALGYSRKQLEVFRENRLTLIRQYVGRHYSNDGAEDKVPMNLLELAINIYLQKLAAKNPAVSITTFHSKLKEIATRFELRGTRTIKELKLGKTLRTAALGAMLCKGIVKIALRKVKVEVDGEEVESVAPFVDPISLDDWIEDMCADTEDTSQFEANYYYPTLDEAHEMFPGHEADIKPRNQVKQSEDKDHAVSEGKGTQREEFIPTVRMLDVYLKKQKMILQCTTTDDENDPIDKVIKSFKWTGPVRGPYRKLGFGEVENCTIPLAPAMHWYDLHELANKVYRKIGRQADRQKTVLYVQRGGQNEADANRVIDANDGEAIPVDNPKAMQEYSTGGVNPQSLAFSMNVKDLFGYLAGNLDMLGGLGPQSETLGQDQLLSNSASMRIQKMQSDMLDFTQGVMEDLMYYVFHDPNPDQPDVVKQLTGFPDIAVIVPFKPEHRMGDFIQYNVNVEPYSMQHMTPESILQGIRTFLAEIVGPLMPMMEKQGVSLDIEKLFKKISKYANNPVLDDIMIYSTPAMDEMSSDGQEGPSKPTSTTRNYTRRSIPGATNAGKSQVLQQALLGANPQRSEVASLQRPTG